MVNDILAAFEREFNNYASYLQADSKLVRDDTNNSATGTLYFADFDVIFEYSCKFSILTCSGINIILDFSKKYGYSFLCTMYDLIPLIDKENFTCWMYAYIENPERMSLCMKKLTQDFDRELQIVIDFISHSDCLTALKNTINENLNRLDLFSVLFDEAAEINDIEKIREDYARDEILDDYLDSQKFLFTSEEYCLFLEGKYKKAYKKYIRKKYRLPYEQNILVFLESENKPERILQEKYCTTSQGKKVRYDGKEFFGSFIVGLLLALIPVSLLAAGFYFLICAFLYNDCIHSTAFNVMSFPNVILPSVFVSVAVAGLAERKITKIFFKKKYKKYCDYSSIIETENSQKMMRIFCYIIYILYVVSIFLFANSAVSMTDSEIIDSTGFFNLSPSHHYYSEVENVAVLDEYEIIINYTDGEFSDLTDYTDIEDFNSEIKPILQEKGIEIIYSNSEE